MNDVRDWLMWLEAKGADEAENLYRWPRTPVGNLQAEIWRRVGASDWNWNNAVCRTRNVVGTIENMIDNRLLPRPFSVLDLCCGDGVVLHLVARSFLDARCFGVDLLRYPTHRDAERAGVTFHRAPLQELVVNEPPRIIDVCIMLNTFRGWDKADLVPEVDHALPELTLAWMGKHCRYVFLTLESAQFDWLRRAGWFVWDVGPGEDDSRLACAFPCEGPEGPRGVWSLEKPKLS